MTRCERGLGLLELIVALMLVTLASTLVMQGIGQGLGMLRRVANDQGVAYHELMARAWLRESVAAAAAQAATVSSDGSDQQEGDAEPSRPAEPPRPVFAGTAATLEMQSFRPLLGAEGVATPIRWSADPQQGLRYDEGDQQAALAAHRVPGPRRQLASAVAPGRCAARGRPAGRCLCVTVGVARTGAFRLWRR
jgi:hypothetical protein